MFSKRVENGLQNSRNLAYAIVRCYSSVLHNENTLRKASSLFEIFSFAEKLNSLFSNTFSHAKQQSVSAKSHSS